MRVTSAELLYAHCRKALDTVKCIDLRRLGVQWVSKGFEECTALRSLFLGNNKLCKFEGLEKW